MDFDDPKYQDSRPSQVVSSFFFLKIFHLKFKNLLVYSEFDILGNAQLLTNATISKAKHLKDSIADSQVTSNKTI